MAFSQHGNRVKHLNGTSHCPHYRGLEASADASTNCATHKEFCQGAANAKSTTATRGCHVVKANQSGAAPARGGGNRYIVYCCPSCNGNKDGTSFSVRLNAIMHNLDGKPCQAAACHGAAHAACDCGVDF